MNNSDTQKLEEALSAFMDDEIHQTDDVTLAGITDTDLVDRMCKDQNLRSDWHCMHVVRDVMQGDYQSALPADFSVLVSERIAREDGNVVSIAETRDRIAQRKPETRQQANTYKSKHYSNAQAANSQRASALWKPIAGLGLAASLTGATILFTQLLQTESDSPDFVAAQSPVVTDTFVANQPDDGTRWHMDTETPPNQEIEDRLDLLLTNHLQDANTGNVDGLVSHSRVVDYDSVPDQSASEQSLVEQTLLEQKK